MEQFSYQRPREKLYSRGAGSLLISELLQVIIGSGTKKVSGAKIAKNASLLLKDNNSEITCEQLISVQGLGLAKACQIIAAIELGRRVTANNEVSKISKQPVFDTLTSVKNRYIEYTTVNGAGIELKTRSEPITSNSSALLSVRSLFANALHDGATLVQVGIGARNFAVTSYGSDTMNIAKKIFDTAELLQISINAVWLVNKTEKYAFRRKELP